jgi:hypothetical protein
MMRMLRCLLTTAIGMSLIIAALQSGYADKYH